MNLLEVRVTPHQQKMEGLRLILLVILLLKKVLLKGLIRQKRATEKAHVLLAYLKVKALRFMVYGRDKDRRVEKV
jgi:hypothetical protein